MNNIVQFPLLVFAMAFVGLWFSASAGVLIRKSLGALKEEQRVDFGVIQTAALTLLGLLIGFTFSIAVGRYDPQTFTGCESRLLAK